VGGAAYEAHGHPLPESTLNLAKAADAVLFGAVGDWKYDKLDRPLRPEQAILGLRKHLGLFANFRPAICYEQLTHASSLKPELVAGLDILIIRELTGDIYFGQPRGRRTAVDGHFPGAEEAFDTMRYSKPGDRAHRPRGLPGRAQAQQEGHQRRQGQRAGDLPVLEGRGHRGARPVPGRRAGAHVRRQRRHAAGQGAQEAFDVVVTGNMFGDILSDEAAMLTGSIGMLPSASLDKANKGLYEPSHGSAPDIAGKGVANPLATILSAAMMLRYTLNQPQAADRIESAVQGRAVAGTAHRGHLERRHEEGRHREMGDAVVAAITWQNHYQDLASRIVSPHPPLDPGERAGRTQGPESIGKVN
jgi:3-isopropylmalate dehydrogenase